MTHKILIAAGGTGGHLIPAQQLGARLALQQNCEVLFAGYKLQESPYFERGAFRFAEIASAPLSASPWRLVSGLTRGFCQALRLLLKERPDVVVGFGSYHSAPVLLASALLRKRIVLFEANRAMGKVNRFALRAATAVGYQFPLLGKHHPKFTPVQWLPWTAPSTWTKERARAAYGLDPTLFTVLVFGGSQGASFLNQMAPAALKRLQSAQVLHLAGSDVAAHETRALYVKEGVRAHVVAYESEMAKAYAAADFALCRSGAGTVAELIRYAVPSLLVPYPHAADQHQRDNARYLCDLGGAILIPQSEATEAAIAAAIKQADYSLMRSALQRALEKNKTTIALDELVRRVCERKT